MVVNCAALRNEVIWAGVTRCSCFYCWQWGKIWCRVPPSDSKAADVKTQHSCLWKRHLKKMINQADKMRPWTLFSSLGSFHHHVTSLDSIQHQWGVRLLMKQVFGDSKRGFDSLTESLCAVDNDLIKETIRTEARPRPATLDLSQLRFPARGKNSFWIPSALLLIKSIHCHCSKRGKTREHKLAHARKTDGSERTLISAYPASGHQMLAARKKRYIF